MGSRQNQDEKFIENEFYKEAGRIQQETEEACGEVHVSEDLKNRMRVHIEEGARQYEKEKVYAQLSQEDREALKMGRDLLHRKTAVRTRKKRRMYLSVAAVLVLALAVGVTAVGGPKRIVEWFSEAVGQREVIKGNAGEISRQSPGEAEEEAYQEIRNLFGVEPVRIIERPDGMKFERMELDESLQTAELFYTYGGETVVYCMNAPYRNAVWGVDVEDETTDGWQEEVLGCRIEMSEYTTSATGTKRYSAKFEYEDVEYFLMGTMDREEVVQIIQNLYFF